MSNREEGQQLQGRYEIISKLGSGGFGDTYLAQDRQRPGNPMCVVKQLKTKNRNPETWQVRLFNQEARVLENLGTHPQIPRLLAYFEENGEFYLAQEFVDGHNLSEEIIPGSRWSESDVIGLLQDIVEVLVFVHQSNVIHRDIKPENLMRRKEDGKIVLIDFGIVKEIVVGDSGHTKATLSIGTPGYMAIEQLVGRPKPCSDIYAVGIIGMQALTGLKPDKLPQDSVTHEFIWRDRTQVSDGLAAVLTKMVRYDWRERYQNACDALQAIQAILRLDSDPPPPPLQGLIKKYLDTFISRYDQIDDFMGVRSQSQGQQSLSGLYVKPNLKDYNEPNSKNYKKFDNVYELLRDGNSPIGLVVTGDAGSGKTTFMQMIGVKQARQEQDRSQASEQDWKIPVFVKLADYASKYAEGRYLASRTNPNQQYKLSDYIAELLTNQFFFQRTSQEVEVELSQGRYLLLLDALDEIGNPNIRQGVRDSIASILSYSKGNGIVTCRSAIAQDYRIQGAYIEELLPLEEEQVINYIENWKSILGEEKTKNLEQQIKSDSRTQKILSNPLLLYMTVGYFKRVSELPSNLNVELYKAVAEHMIEQRPKERMRGSDERPLIDESKRRKYFHSIAYQLHQNKERNVRKGILVNAIKEVDPDLSLSKAEDYLNFLVEEIGLLQKLKTNNEKYEFLHFTFQEFFVAEYYLEQKESAELLKEALNASSWWSPVIVFYYALNNSRGQKFLEQLIDEDNEFAIGTTLASDCLMQVVPNQEDRNGQFYGKLYEKLQTLREASEYELLQQLAWTKLKKVGGSKVIGFLDNELAPDQSDHRQKDALAALGEIGTDKAVEIIADAAQMYLDSDDEKPNLLLSAIEALLAANTEKSEQQIKDLVEQVIEAQNHRLIEAIVSPLARTNRRDYIERMLELLQQTPPQDKLYKIILKELGNPADPANVLDKIGTMFEQQLEAGNSDASRVVTILNAIQFQTTGEIGKKIRECAKSLLKQGDKAQLKAAIRFLSRQNDTSVIDNEELLNLLLDSEDPKLQQEILKALGQLLGQLNEPDEFHEELLHDCINDYRSSSSLLMAHGIASLGQFGSNKSFDYLLKELERDEGEREVKAATVKALYQISKRKTIKPKPELGNCILNYLKNNPVTDTSLAEAAVFILWQISSTKQMKELLHLIHPVPQQPESHSENSTIRRFLSDALLGYLLKLKTKEDCPRPFRADVRNWVNACIDQEFIDAKLAAKALKVELKLQFLKLRQETLRDTLQENKSASICIISIEEACQDKEFSPTEFLRGLLDLLNHPDPEVVNKAIEMLGENGNNDQEMLHAVKQALRVLLNNNRYRKNAFEALWTLAK